MPDNFNNPGGNNAPVPAGGTNPADSSTQTQDRPFFDPSLHVEKSEFTRLRQADAAARAEAERRVQEREGQLTAREQQLLQAAQILRERLKESQNSGRTNDRFADIRGLEYIDGPTLAKMLEKFDTEGIGGIHNQIQQRDKALQMLWAHVQKLTQTLNQYQGKTVEQEFDQRLAKVRDSLGLPNEEWVNEWLNDVYRSHEGDDLADAFPDMARTRFEKIRKAIRAMDKAEAEKARSMNIPGKGGEGVPSGKLDELKGKSARDRASLLYDQLIGPGNGGE